MKLIEAVDISKFTTPNDLTKIGIGIENSRLEQIKQKDDLVLAYHGTSEFWALWFCLYGVDSTIEPPSKTLGRGNMQTGFSKIKTSGLFVSGYALSGFNIQVIFEVKPSELGISLEMEELGYEKGQELYTLGIGDCLIIEPLKAKRVNSVLFDGKIYSRSQFINRFPDPQKYIDRHYQQKMYSDSELLYKKNLDDAYKELKSMIKDDGIDSVIEIIDDGIKNKDWVTWGVTEKDMHDLLAWAKSKKGNVHESFLESKLSAKDFFENTEYFLNKHFLSEREFNLFIKAFKETYKDWTIVKDTRENMFYGIDKKENVMIWKYDYIDNTLYTDVELFKFIRNVFPSAI